MDGFLEIAQIGIAGIGALGKILSWFRSKRLKNGKVVYVNCNKAAFDEDRINDFGDIRRNDFQIVRCSTVPTSYPKNLKKHLKKQKRALYAIYKSARELIDIVYAGYCSVPLAAYDGYILGDTRNYRFLDNLKSQNELYLVEFAPGQTQAFAFPEIALGTADVSLIVETSGPIPPEALPHYPIIKCPFEKKDRITKDDLFGVFSFVRQAVEYCGSKGIKTVHVFARCKQPISFVIGTAIKAYGPRIKVYECIGGSYPIRLDFGTQEWEKTE